jgi:hypothetical protein
MLHRKLAALALAGALIGALVGAAPAQAGGRHRPAPLPNAHAHNDYLHERPLYDALSHGFTSVEADIFLVDGKLLVAHAPEELDPALTLQKLYLDPLARIVRANKGKVFRGSKQQLQLLIDIKYDGVNAYTKLDRVLRKYRKMLTTYVDGEVKQGAVTVVISGDRPRDLMASQRVRYAFYDGRGPDLGTGVPASFMPLLSENWTGVFTWRGVGEMPAGERQFLHQAVAIAHASGQRVRFWATPDVPGPAREAVWRELLAAGVDHINTDDLAGLEAFLRS